jgi:hypothetical protein
MPKCPKCTLRNSLSRLANTYSSSISKILRGNNTNIDMLSEIFYGIFNANYSYPGKTIEEKMEKLKGSFIKSLSNLPERNTFESWKMYPKNAKIDLIDSIVIDTTFRINDNSEMKQIVDGSLRDEDQKKNIFKKIYGEDVIEKFKLLLCRYNIIDELKKRYVSLSFEDYYFLTENVIKYPKENAHQKQYIDWCNRFLTQMYSIHGIESQQIDPKYLVQEGDLTQLVFNSTTPLVVSINNNIAKR